MCTIVWRPKAATTPKLASRSDNGEVSRDDDHHHHPHKSSSWWLWRRLAFRSSRSLLSAAVTSRGGAIYATRKKKASLSPLCSAPQWFTEDRNSCKYITLMYTRCNDPKECTNTAGIGDSVLVLVTQDRSKLVLNGMWVHEFGKHNESFCLAIN